mgnify:CR=1 FL=1
MVNGVLENIQEELVKRYNILERIAKILGANTNNKNKEDQNKLLQSVTGLISALVAGNGTCTTIIAIKG